jgi:hypothetical protein
MKNQNLILIALSALFLNGCVQSAALVGPALTVASTGNIYQGAFTYGSNKAVEKETGKNTITYVSDLMEGNKEKKVKNKIDEDFVILVKNNILKTRSKLLNKN